LIMRANLYNAGHTDDRVSYKKLAHTFLRNAVLGFVLLAFVLVGMAVRNLIQ
jgi:hypothetical protein